MPETYYAILDVHKQASADEIEEAYRAMVRRCHPDLKPDDLAARQRFQQVQMAFDVLHNIESRREYDRSFEKNIDMRLDGSLELFDDETAAKPGEPIVASIDAHDLDQARFRDREPGRYLQIYRPRSLLGSIQDWLLSSDFVLPLLLLLILMGIQIAGVVWEMCGGTP